MGKRRITTVAESENWLYVRWRPMMGWVYMITCVADFIVFPILWAILHAMLKLPQTPWEPLTLQGAGLYHLSMGAILGVAAYGRTQEKLAIMNIESMNGTNRGLAPGMMSPDMQPRSTTVTTTFGQSKYRRPGPVPPEDPVL